MGGPIESRRFGLPGAAEQKPWAAAGGSAISPLFNIGGAPIALLGGVFGDGFPLGGPVSQLYRTGGPVPNVLYASTLTSAGPIGAFLIGLPGTPLSGFGAANQPITFSTVGEIGLPAFAITGYGGGGLPISPIGSLAPRFFIPVRGAAAGPGGTPIGFERMGSSPGLTGLELLLPASGPLLGLVASGLGRAGAPMGSAR